jgi:hypothetical protein
VACRLAPLANIADGDTSFSAILPGSRQFCVSGWLADQYRQQRHVVFSYFTRIETILHIGSLRSSISLTVEISPIRPPEVRQLPNLFAKRVYAADQSGIENWRVESCFSYARLNQYRFFGTCNDTLNYVRCGDTEPKVTSIPASKGQTPEDPPEARAIGLRTFNDYHL